jgi:hypothetical protein
MNRKLTIMVSDEVYQGLHRTVGRRRIGQFLNWPARTWCLKTWRRRTAKLRATSNANARPTSGPKASSET